MIEIIPAIDIIDGRCVRLSQGDYNRLTTYDASPVDMAKRYAEAGVKRLHLVDLDGAKSGQPRNLQVLENISALNLLDIEWGGGIKSEEGLKSVFDAGAQHAIIGSLAVKHPSVMAKWLTEYGGEKIILGADLRNGMVSVSGWLEDSLFTVHDLLNRFIPYHLREVVTTDITKDGMLQGPATQLYLDLMQLYPDITFTVSGGISSMSDIEDLSSFGVKRVIVGKAIYEGRITLQEIANWNNKC